MSLYPDYDWEFLAADMFISGDGEGNCGRDLAIRYDYYNEMVCIYEIGYMGTNSPSYHHVPFVARYSPWGERNWVCNDVEYGSTDDEKAFSGVYYRVSSDYNRIVVAGYVGDNAEVIKYNDGCTYGSRDDQEEWLGTFVDKSEARSIIHKRDGTPQSDFFYLTGTSVSTAFSNGATNNVQLTKIEWTENEYDVCFQSEWG